MPSTSLSTMGKYTRVMQINERVAGMIIESIPELDTLWFNNSKGQVRTTLNIKETHCHCFYM